MHPFEKILSVSLEEIEFSLTACGLSQWEDYLLNPRRLRGSDFLMRWSQGVWSESRLVDAVNASERYCAVAYGPSSVAPDNDVRAFELYFERLEAAGLGGIKRPDLLIFSKSQEDRARTLISHLGGDSELPFMPEDLPEMKELHSISLAGIECENSLWVSKKMRGYGSALKPMRRLGGKLGLSKSMVVPTVIVKEEDRHSLQAWQDSTGVPIHIWHAFYDDAYGLAFDRLQNLIAEGSVEPTVQTLQAPGGAISRKIIYKTPYQHAYKLAKSKGEPTLVADSIMDANGHILPYVRFSGGVLDLETEGLRMLDSLAGYA